MPENFKPVDPKNSFPKMEEKILKFWDEKKIFEKSLEKNRSRKNFVFFEGPPTANGKPGIHHVLARAFKDVIPRFKTMQGYYVARKAGWDTHGLPVELEVEKKLGISGKPEIEKYGIKEFNRKCKESVWEYLEDWRELTRRIAFWLDLEHPYATYDNSYVESLWWVIKQIYDRKLLYSGHKVVPHCPRCGTALSSHEVALGYQDVTEPSVYVKFKVKGEDNTYILSWTTTPWTLPGNVALAVGVDIDYVKIKIGEEKFILAKERLSVIDGEYEIVAEMKGKKLEGLKYEPLFDSLVDSSDKKIHYVTTANFVTTVDGTGVVHTAVMYGEDDYNLGLEKDLPQIHTVNEDGRFNKLVPEFEGKFVKDCDRLIASDLKDQNLLLKVENYKHSYPFCWRCNTPLLYYAKTSWFIKMTAVKKDLLKNAAEINWVPEHTKKGRFGLWLENVKDWALSRERYWGTPLPIWKCEKCGKMECVGSLAELKEKAVGKIDIEKLDLHRPYVDAIKFKCQCGGEMIRDKAVLDCWFDSGAMPFAQHHYPFENQDLVDENKQYPADYISEAIDQTRGWFYTLLAVSTLLNKGASYKNVICLGHINDKHGKKMSKSKGNVIDPWTIADQYGIDALRWYLYTINAPGEPKRFDLKGVEEIVKNVLLKLWNTYSFFVTYANIDGFTPSEAAKSPANIIDRWIISKLEEVKGKVTKNLEEYQINEACLVLENFVVDLSNWYVRRSRRRFWKSENDADKAQAYETLYYVLLEVSKLIAPFMPFISEELYRGLNGHQESVHLEEFPKNQKSLIDAKLNADMEFAQRVVTLGHAARAKKQIKVRQPLQEILIGGAKLPGEEFLKVIREELNVKQINVLESQESLIKESVKLKFALLGKKYGEKLKEIQKLLAAGKYSLTSENKLEFSRELILEPEEFEKIYDSKNSAYSVCAEKNLFVALKTELTPELEKEGHAREIVRTLQEMRKDAGYNVADRIAVYFQGAKMAAEVFKDFEAYLKQETLAQNLANKKDKVDLEKEIKIAGKKIWLGVKRV